MKRWRWYPGVHSAAWQPGRFSSQLHLHTHLSATLSHTLFHTCIPLSNTLFHTCIPRSITLFQTCIPLSITLKYTCTPLSNTLFHKCIPLSNTSFHTCMPLSHTLFHTSISRLLFHTRITLSHTLKPDSHNWYITQLFFEVHKPLLPRYKHTSLCHTSWFANSFLPWVTCLGSGVLGQGFGVFGLRSGRGMNNWAWRISIVGVGW